MASFPCKDCNDKYLGCHAKCEEYLEAKKNHEKEKEAKREYCFVLYAGRKDSVERMKKYNPRAVWKAGKRSA